MTTIDENADCATQGHDHAIEIRRPGQHQEIIDAGFVVPMIPVRVACARCGTTLKESRVPQAELEDRLAHIVAVAGACERLTRGWCGDDGGYHFNTGYGADSYCLPCQIRVLAQGETQIWKVAT